MTTTLPRVRESGGRGVPEQPKQRHAGIKAIGLLLAVIALVLLAAASVAVGAKGIPLSTVWSALFDFHGLDDQIVVRELRLPRTVIGIGVGAALGLAGALMQALTRNPIAEPGILGVNQGASAAVVTAIGFLGIGGGTGYVWFAFLGAAVVSVAVYLLGSRGPSGATPVRLALAGTAISAALTAYISAMQLLYPQVFDQFRFWQVGSLAGRDAGVLYQVGPFLLAGIVLALLLARPLNAIALGEDTARSLGAHLGRTRALGAIAITLLCGSATAAAGPISFVGLAMPHVARAITGPDQRWLLPYSMVLSPVLLLGADILGRVVVSPGELEVGLVTAFLGAPVFIMLVRRKRLAKL